jgi:hypothetical protein
MAAPSKCSIECCKEKTEGNFTTLQMQGHSIHVYNKSNTIPIEPGSVGTNSSNKSCCPKQPGCSWPEAGLPTWPCRKQEIKHAPIPAEAFPRVSADTLYLGYDCEEKRTRLKNRIDGYNVADGTSERCYHHKSFVDYLSRCIRGTNKHLA